MTATKISIATIVILGLMTPAASLAADREPARAARRTPVVEVFESTRDAVVNISSKEIVTARSPFGFDSIFEDFFDMPGGTDDGNRRAPGRQYTRTSVGSGFVIHPDGYIVTNAHVVAQTAERKAIFSDGREYVAEVIAFDTARDLAVLKIDPGQAPLHSIRLGRSDDLMVGETVIAIGNPLGFQHTVTSGVVSAVRRNLELGRDKSLKDLIQTDASINPGNSGGPLLNVLGELIGINTAIRGDAQNIGFAIPVDQLREVLPELLDIERRYRVVCGLTVDTFNSPRVTAVAVDSPAQRAGVKVGDTLCSIDGKAIREGIDFPIALIGCQAGQTIALQLQRDGKAVDAKLKLEARPMPDGMKLALERLGMEVQSLEPADAEAMGFSGASGLLVTAVEPDGPAAAGGIRRRDVLVGVGRHGVASPEELGLVLEVVKPGESIPVSVLRVDRWTKLRMSGELQAR